MPEANASTVFYESMANHDRVLDGIVSGSELLSWDIKGHDAHGTSFDLPVTDRYVSDYDITWEAGWELADFTNALSSVPGVTLDSVTMSSAVNDDNSVWSITKLEQRVQNTWVTLGKHSPLVARAGQTVPLRATLSSASGVTKVPVTLKVPSSAAHSDGMLQVVGGSEIWSRNAYPRSVAQAQKYVDTLVRNDQMQVSLELYAKRKPITKSATTDPQDKVVTGHKRVRVIVK